MSKLVIGNQHSVQANSLSKPAKIIDNDKRALTGKYGVPLNISQYDEASIEYNLFAIESFLFRATKLS